MKASKKLINDSRLDFVFKLFSNFTLPFPSFELCKRAKE